MCLKYSILGKSNIVKNVCQVAKIVFIIKVVILVTSAFIINHRSYLFYFY